MEKLEVGARIQQLREERHMTQNRLAMEAGISANYVAQLERGEKSPTVEYLSHICWGLGITIQEFFKEEKEGEGVTIDTLTEDQRQALNKFLKTL